MFYDTSRFAFTAVLEQNWQRMYAEYLAARAFLEDWRGKKLYDEGWKALPLFDFPTGAPLADNIARCPVTAALVHDHVPGHGVAGFSVLLPQVRVKPHQDHPSPYVRCHLPLRVPAGDCGLRVADEVRRWEPGRLVLFDHTVNHETWNLTGEERVLLLIDFIPEPGALVPVS